MDHPVVYAVLGKVSYDASFLIVGVSWLKMSGSASRRGNELSEVSERDEPRGWIEEPMKSIKEMNGLNDIEWGQCPQPEPQVDVFRIRWLEPFRGPSYRSREVELDLRVE